MEELKTEVKNMTRKSFPLFPLIILSFALVIITGIVGYTLLNKERLFPKQSSNLVRSNQGSNNQSSNSSDEDIDSGPSDTVGQTTKAPKNKLIYSLQTESNDDIRTIYSADLLSGQKIEIATYSGGVSDATPVPKVSDNGRIVYLDMSHNLYTVDLDGTKKLLTESSENYRIFGFLISPDGKTVIYQEMTEKRPLSFNLWKIDTETNEKESLFSSSSNLLSLVKLSADSRKVFVINSDIDDFGAIDTTGFGEVYLLQTIDLETKAITDILQREFIAGITISPDDKYGIIIYLEDPTGLPIGPKPSEKYPEKLSYIDLFTGSETLLVQNTSKYIYPVAWFSDSKKFIYLERPDYNQIPYPTDQEIFKKVNLESKDVTELFAASGPYDWTWDGRPILFNDSALIYSWRFNINKAGEPLTEVTAVYKTDLDGTNEVEIDKQARFLHLIGLTSEQ